MAGENKTEEHQSKIENVVLSWMFDYTCYRTWNQFLKTLSITESDKDLIQGISGIVHDGDMKQAKEALKMKWLFVVIVCRLSDGEDITIQYDDNSEESPLECLLPTFEQLVNLQKPDLKEEGLKLLSIIKSEAVLVYCRAAALDLAKKALHRLWKVDKLDSEEKLMRKNLKMIIEKSSRDHNLKSYTYENFLLTMKKYLDKIFKSFPTPLLLEAAERKIELEKKIMESETGSENERKRKYSSLKLSLECVKDSVITEGPDSEKDKNEGTKLKKLWNQNVDKLFEESPPHEPQEKRRMLPPAIPKNKTKSTLQKSPVAKKQAVTSQEDSPTSTTGNNQTDSPVASTSTATQEPTKTRSTKSSTKESPAPRVEMGYKKNIGRPNRHDPAQANKNQNYVDWDSQSLSMSVISVSGTRSKWTKEETEDFFCAVQTLGVGNWSEIREYLDSKRTNVNLKDKWRTMLKNGEAERLAKERHKSKKK